MRDSKKIFEIPIYALSRSKLQKRVKNAEEAYKKEYLQSHLKPDNNHYRECLRLLLYPQRLWDYNHIIGFVLIKSDGQDILFEEYLPYKTVERYHWKVSTKHFVVNQMSPGMHFPIWKKSSQEIKENIQLFLNEFENRLKKRGYVLDREAFDNIAPYIDFKKLVEGELGHGQTQDAQRWQGAAAHRADTRAVPQLRDRDEERQGRDHLCR